MQGHKLKSNLLSIFLKMTATSNTAERCGKQLRKTSEKALKTQSAILESKSSIKGMEESGMASVKTNKITVLGWEWDSLVILTRRFLFPRQEFRTRLHFNLIGNPLLWGNIQSTVPFAQMRQYRWVQDLKRKCCLHFPSKLLTQFT